MFPWSAPKYKVKVNLELYYKGVAAASYNGCTFNTDGKTFKIHDCSSFFVQAVLLGTRAVSYDDENIPLREDENHILLTGDIVDKTTFPESWKKPTPHPYWSPF